MKFVSKSPALKMTFESTTQRAEVGANGVTRYTQNPDGFTCEWQKRTLDTAELTAAQEQILAVGGRYAFGSVPGQDEGNINIQDAADLGYSSTAHEGFDIWQRLSVFDTDDPTMCPPERKHEVEEWLLNHYELGRDYVRVDNYNLTPPWPNYPIAGEYSVKDVLTFAKVGGLVNASLVYEKAVGGRQDLIEALEAESEAQKARELEQADLTATV